MKIHAIQTGTVQVHEAQRAGSGHGVLRFARTLLDRRWTEPLPIYAWVIEHPEGVIVVDTGETSRTARPGYLPPWHPYFRLGVRMQVEADQELGPALRGLGIGPGDVRWVVLTHLHTDHAGGLSHVMDAEILVTREEYQDARGVQGRIRGYLPNRWPTGFSPRLVTFRPEPFGPFPESAPLTRAGDVRLLPTPGHTRGHMSVALELADRVLLFAGDTSYTEGLLQEGTVDGVSSMGGGEEVAARTLQRIQELARERPLVYLPSHDPGARHRLAARRAVATPPVPSASR